MTRAGVAVFVAQATLGNGEGLSFVTKYNEMDFAMTHPIITLTTDFGYADGYVGALKGVILSIAPQVTIVDITHGIAPQAITQAAYVLQQAVPYFPADTIHVAVVDPDVGSARRPLAVRMDHATFVGPDNGLFTPFITAATNAQIIHLTAPQYWRPQPSATFHGRDIFAPVAAHLAAGVSLSGLGVPVEDPVRITGQAPSRMAGGALHATVIHIDHFGNLITNLPADWLGQGQWTIEVHGEVVPAISSNYAAVARGMLVAYVGSSGTLEVAVRDGSAAQVLASRRGDSVLARPA